MSTSNLRIFLSIFFSGIIIFFVNQYSQNPLLFIKKVENLPKNISSSIQNLHFPKINFNLFLSSKPNWQSQENNQSNQNSSFTLPTSTEKIITPTKILNNYYQNIPSPSIYYQIKKTPTEITSLIIPTQIPIKILKPTKPPKPSPTPLPPPITTDERPGQTMEEIFQEVSKRMCIPFALLRAFQTQESGPYFSYNSPSSTIKIYNTYGWWIDGKGDPCVGLGYYTQSGLVPNDSIKAGQTCRNAVQPDAYDQKIMGIFQISEYEQNGAYKYLKNTFPKNYDRRVLFDNAMIFAIITKNRISGSPPKNCNDWPEDIIKLVAEKHYGNCGDNYCANILKYYKQYK